MSPLARFAQFGMTSWRGEPHIMESTHRHNDIEVNFIEQGALSYWLGGGVVHLAVEHFMVFWATVPHRVIDVAPQTQFYWLTLPLNTFLRWEIGALTQPLLQGKVVVDTPNRNDKLQFERWADDAQKGNDYKDILLLELEARLKRLALSQFAIAHDQANKHSLAEQIARWIADHHTEPIDITDIAHAVNLHPNYAMRLFRANFGRSINDTLVQFRVATAQRLLVTTDLSASEIAFQSGFGSVSRFYAVFKGWCGQSPTEYRTRLLAPQPPSDDLSQI